MKILYFFPRPVGDDLARVERGLIPSDRLYGLVELSRRGYSVDVADNRFVGSWGPAIRALRKHGLSLCDPSTLRRLRNYDVVLVKDEFSPAVTLACRALGVKLVYLDAMFNLPRSPWSVLAARGHLHLADGVIAYSRSQIKLWANRFNLGPERFHFLPYTIDVGFYRPVSPRFPAEPYILTVGRDLGRQFSMLVGAMDGLGIGLKIVTRPYLLKDVNVAKPWIEVLENLSYPELFRLYANATAVVIPLKEAVTYPSGVRGLLEAMALGKPVISTRTPVLEEYVPHEQGVIYVEAGDVEQMRTQIVRVCGDERLRARLEESGAALVRERYGMDVFARGLDSYLTELRGASVARHGD